MAITRPGASSSVWIVEADDYDAHPFTGILEAVHERNLLQLRNLLQEGFDLNSTPLPGVPPVLIHAACEGHSDVVDLLLDHQANPAAQDPTYGGTALHWAAANNEYHMLTLLLERDADITSTSYSGATPLHVAAGQGHSACVRTLLRASADPDAADLFGSTPLHEAAYGGHIKAVTALLRQNADPDKQDRQKDTALHVAARRGHVHVVEELLVAGADAEIANAAGVTPLMSAAFFGHDSIVSSLLARGVNARAFDAMQHRSSLHWAALNDHLKVVQALMKASSGFEDLLDAQGFTALDLAAEADAASVLSLLRGL